MPRKHYNIKVTPHRRAKPDTHKLSRALLLLAAADAERAAQAEHEGGPLPRPKTESTSGGQS
jgi:hypothetical protein